MCGHSLFLLNAFLLPVNLKSSLAVLTKDDCKYHLLFGLPAHVMHITPEQQKEFIQLYKARFGDITTEAEIAACANLVFQLMEIVYRPLPTIQL